MRFPALQDWVAGWLGTHVLLYHVDPVGWGIAVQLTYWACCFFIGHEIGWGMRGRNPFR